VPAAGRNAAEAQAMVSAVEAAGTNMVWAYRRVPAVVLLKCWSTKAGSGASSLSRSFSRTGRSRGHTQGGEGLWRLDVGVAGSGVAGDLLAHCIDTALWLNSSIAEVTAMTETFVKERTLTGRWRRCIDDASAFLGRFENGSSRCSSHSVCARSQGALHAGDQRR
jgi:myo-inositol 2-dehydrogenase/D-chiro-inositol 1-dehydrogenase